MGKWKKTENEEGFLYYINQETNAQQWDHPKFSDIKQAIDDCNYVVYSTYRLALKIRVLQRCLHIEEVPLSTITAIFKKHRLGNNESSLILETCDLEVVLSDIFFAANNKNHTNIDVDFATEIFINFLYNVFDSCRKGKIQVFTVKLLLGILCHSSLADTHRYLFSLCADHNNCITRKRLQGLLQKIAIIIKYLHEDSFFGDKSVNAAIADCFQDSPGLVGITESGFIFWLNSGVPFLSWMSLVLKLKNAETVMHSVKCTTCKARPIIGLKYRCIKCPKYTQCQRCFLTGRISHSHKLSHSLREYSSISSSKGSINVFLDKICSLFCPRNIESYNYSIVRPGKQFANENIKPYQSTDPLCDIEPLSSPEAQLQGVIRQLESQNRELQQMLIFGNYSDKEMRKYLEEYRLFMAGNIKKLKMLRNQINISIDHYVNPVEHLTSNGVAPGAVRDKNAYSEYTESPLTVMTELEDRLCNNEIRDKVHSTVNPKKFDGYGVWSEGNQSPNALPENVEKTSTNEEPKLLVKLSHNDLDEALAKLQQILAINFSSDDSLSNMDNMNLKYAVDEVEGMLSSIIDNVESSRCNSALQEQFQAPFSLNNTEKLKHPSNT